MDSSIRTKIHEIDPGGPRPDTLIIPDTLIYVVNFDDDGYFSSGVFNPGNQNFNWWFRMITYDNPNNN